MLNNPVKGLQAVLLNGKLNLVFFPLATTTEQQLVKLEPATFLYCRCAISLERNCVWRIELSEYENGSYRHLWCGETNLEIRYNSVDVRKQVKLTVYILLPPPSTRWALPCHANYVVYRARTRGLS